jgi:hypothetical protein
MSILFLMPLSSNALLNRVYFLSEDSNPAGRTRKHKTGKGAEPSDPPFNLYQGRIPPKDQAGPFWRIERRREILE